MFFSQSSRTWQGGWDAAVLAKKQDPGLRIEKKKLLYNYEIFIIVNLYLEDGKSYL